MSKKIMHICFRIYDINITFALFGKHIEEDI